MPFGIGIGFNTVDDGRPEVGRSARIGWKLDVLCSVKAETVCAEVVTFFQQADNGVLYLFVACVQIRPSAETVSQAVGAAVAVLLTVIDAA